MDFMGNFSEPRERGGGRINLWLSNEEERSFRENVLEQQ